MASIEVTIALQLSTIFFFLLACKYEIAPVKSEHCNYQKSAFRMQMILNYII